VKGLYQYITDWYQKEIDKQETRKNKTPVDSERRDEVLKKVFPNTEELINIFRFMNVITSKADGDR
jgi:hypothetical protein